MSACGDAGASLRWRDLLRDATLVLTDAGVEDPSTQVRWLVHEVAGSDPVLIGDLVPDVDQAQRFEALVDRRATGEPLQYVIGHWPFRSLDLRVDRRALIPRFETEEVAGVAIDVLAKGGVSEPVVVDLGVGSGALALALADEVPGCQVWGVERSRPALALAIENRQRTALENVQFVEGSWFAPLPGELRGCVDLIVSNPPYVATSDVLDAAVVAWEPSEALFAGADGLDDVRHIVTQSQAWLGPNGVLVMEIGSSQGAAVRELANEAGFNRVAIRRDLAGLDRILVAHIGH